ncbi:MAG TPA: hypothetical protein VGH28_27280 [Polyangiaceae bacterium]|jgi:hypothetical protein
MSRAHGTLVVLLAVALAACASVLGFKRAEDRSRPFEHRAHVLKGIACTQCHEKIRTSTRESALDLPNTARCVSCHEKPHDTHECSTCHGESSAREEAELVHAQLRFDHGSHQRATGGDCARCHQGVANDATARLLPKMATCFGCHKHRDEWDVRKCDGCHVNVSAEEVTPDSHVVHDGDFIREHGVRAASNRDLCASCHDDRSCAKCHGVTVPALPWKLAVGDAPRTTGVHLSGFRSRHPLEARAQPGLCNTCHAEQFCVECHTQLGVSATAQNARSPHPAGWISATGGAHATEARTDPMSCAGCHGGGGEQLCVGCHKVGGPGGSPHGLGFTSSKDKVREMPCRLCHGASR